MSSDQIRWSRQKEVDLTWVHKSNEFSHRLITKKLHGSPFSFHITTYMPNFETMVYGDGITEVVLYCLNGWSTQIVEDTGECREFQQGDAVYLPKIYTYRHVIGEAGLVVAVCAYPSKEVGDK